MAAIDRTLFWTKVRALSIREGTKQAEGCEAAMIEWEKRNLADVKQLAYMMATAYWETDKTMQPIEEYGKGFGLPYGVPTGPYGNIYYGRGFVQVTWLRNYQLMEDHLNVPLVKNPELALQLDIALQILFDGMLEGMFTELPLSRFVLAEKADFVNARRVVNGMDCANTIANIARSFWMALGGPDYLRVLRRGDVGGDVEMLQDALMKTKMYGGHIDGDYGQLTERAVVAFQVSRHFDLVDGVAGNQTYQALGL